MANISPGVDSIREGLESLPQEIYEKIYKDVFTAPPGVCFPSSSSYSHPTRIEGYRWQESWWGDTVRRSKCILYDPKLLHVDHASRDLYARTLYGGDRWFVFDGGASTHCTSIKKWAYCLWLDMLPAAHRALFPKIILHDATGEEDIGWTRFAMERAGYAKGNSANVFLQRRAEYRHHVFDGTNSTVFTSFSVTVDEEGWIVWLPRTYETDWKMYALPGESQIDCYERICWL